MHACSRTERKGEGGRETGRDAAGGEVAEGWGVRSGTEEGGSEPLPQPKNGSEFVRLGKGGLGRRCPRWKRGHGVGSKWTSGRPLSKGRCPGGFA